MDNLVWRKNHILKMRQEEAQMELKIHKETIELDDKFLNGEINEEAYDLGLKNLTDRDFARLDEIIQELRIRLMAQRN